jgi:hypothetical protein
MVRGVAVPAPKDAPKSMVVRTPVAASKGAPIMDRNGPDRASSIIAGSKQPMMDRTAKKAEPRRAAVVEKPGSNGVGRTKVTSARVTATPLPTEDKASTKITTKPGGVDDKAKLEEVKKLHQDLLDSTDSEEKKVIRRKLRARGHWGASKMAPHINGKKLVPTA